MRKPCTVDTVNGNSHTIDTVDTVVSAMKNACKDVSYSNNSHITFELNSHIDLELNSESEAHTDHDLILGNEQNRIFYIIKKMMKKFLNMRSSTKASNSVDQKQCKKISLDLNELNQDQIIQIINEMEFHLKIQSSANQRDATDECCGRVKDEHFGPDKDEFYMPGKWIFRAWCGSAISSQIAEGVCQAISGRLIGVD
jgi:hypothetical protein